MSWARAPSIACRSTGITRRRRSPSSQPRRAWARSVTGSLAHGQHAEGSACGDSSSQRGERRSWAASLTRRGRRDRTARVSGLPDLLDLDRFARRRAGRETVGLRGHLRPHRPLQRKVLFIRKGEQLCGSIASRTRSSTSTRADRARDRRPRRLDIEVVGLEGVPSESGPCTAGARSRMPSSSKPPRPSSTTSCVSKTSTAAPTDRSRRSRHERMAGRGKSARRRTESGTKRVPHGTRFRIRSPWEEAGST